MKKKSMLKILAIVVAGMSACTSVEQSAASADDPAWSLETSFCRQNLGDHHWRRRFAGAVSNDGMSFLLTPDFTPEDTIYFFDRSSDAITPIQSIDSGWRVLSSTFSSTGRYAAIVFERVAEINETRIVILDTSDFTFRTIGSPGHYYKLPTFGANDHILFYARGANDEVFSDGEGYQNRSTNVFSIYAVDLTNDREQVQIYSNQEVAPLACQQTGEVTAMAWGFVGDLIYLGSGELLVQVGNPMAPTCFRGDLLFAVPMPDPEGDLRGWISVPLALPHSGNVGSLQLNSRHWWGDETAILDVSSSGVAILGSQPWPDQPVVISPEITSTRLASELPFFHELRNSRQSWVASPSFSAAFSERRGEVGVLNFASNLLGEGGEEAAFELVSYKNSTQSSPLCVFDE
ncbi:hypothetical protein [Maricaulis salignorans]|uniref:hypothetical protein n=1 Tax=Maricaulis salignorans TaxID=144026 RepID=UPI003A8F13F3